MTGEVFNMRRLPGRLTSPQASALIGFAEHDLAILAAAGLIRPLGKPAPNAPKYWSSSELVQLCSDRQWLDKATKAISQKWKEKNEAAKTNQAGQAAA